MKTTILGKKKKNPEHDFENEGDPYLYGSYIQKPVA